MKKLLKSLKVLNKVYMISELIQNDLGNPITFWKTEEK